MGIQQSRNCTQNVCITLPSTNINKIKACLLLTWVNSNHLEGNLKKILFFFLHCLNFQIVSLEENWVTQIQETQHVFLVCTTTWVGSLCYLIIKSIKKWVETGKNTMFTYMLCQCGNMIWSTHTHMHINPVCLAQLSQPIRLTSLELYWNLPVLSHWKMFFNSNREGNGE